MMFQPTFTSDEPKLSLAWSTLKTAWVIWGGGPVCFHHTRGDAPDFYATTAQIILGFC
jgi:hypothetical protein